MQKKWLKKVGVASMTTVLVLGSSQMVNAAENGEWKLKEDVETLWDENKQGEVPSFINGKLSDQQITSEKDVAKFFQANQAVFKLNPKTELKFLEADVDDVGMTHYKYQPKIQNIPIDNSKVVVHVNQHNKIAAINGEFHPKAPTKLKEERKLTKKEAVSKAWKHIDVKRSEADQKIQSLTGEVFNSLEENAQLVVFQNNDNYTLAYRVELQFAQPSPANWQIWLNAENGKILKASNQVKEAAQTGTGVGTLGDTKDLNTFLHQNSYYLYDTTKEMDGVIETFDNQGGSQYQLPGIYVTDSDNQFTSESQKAAVDAHYYASEVFDYYYDTFDRVSYDNNGASIRSSVNFGNDYNNAAWVGNQMIYGNGDGDTFTYLSGAKDIVAHELTHAVIQETADLVYENQPGALNESFADVFGYFVDTEDWLLGEDVFTPGTEGDALRSLADPTAYNQPDHMDDYQNLPNTSEGDWGGVHINSGIANKAAYHTIEAIGANKAEQIYYRALTVYLTPNSSFLDAHQALIQSASDLYDTETTNAIAEAWEQVGIQ
ncbi:M4 family metallopeptidase [Virgibacillus pantothenticus]|uniref:M4 family metallopeptidase n=1 Tax=Virgibacillus pantothenticus TaxID=1473 RepID=UPI002014AD43|nr:M4 family metallopeptidase [Virgibacillus pantothenticus]